MTAGGPPVDPAIVDYYARWAEEDRLAGEIAPFYLEGVRTRELLERHLPPPPATVLDIGGGAGAYAFWLAGRGYTVHLIDRSPRLVYVAGRRNAGAERRLASCAVGDARAVAMRDGSADIVLMLGPLYHLPDAGDRRRALLEAVRLLRRGATFVGAGISRWSSTLDGLSQELLGDPQFRPIAEQDLTTGQHRNPTGKLEYFTTAYLHRPDELQDEVEAAGMSVLGLYGIEGPGWILPDLAARMADPARRDVVLTAARMLEREPEMRGVSAHLLVVARKAARP